MHARRTKNKFIELKAKGLSYDKISKRLKTSKQTLINWGREFEKEIEELKGYELEALREKYYLQKEKRLELFGEEILRLKKEIVKRKLNKIPTYRLFDLLLKIYSLLDREDKNMFETDRMHAQTQKIIEEIRKIHPDEKKRNVCIIIEDLKASHRKKSKRLQDS